MNKLYYFLFALTPLSLFAEEVEHSFLYKELKYTVIGEDSVSVTGVAYGTIYDKSYVMPDCVYDMEKAYTVVSIGDGYGPLMEYKGILMGGSRLDIRADTLYLPKTLKEIGDYGLAGLSCRRIIIPDGLEQIGSYAIYGCLNLDSIWLPASLKKINRSLFKGNEALKYVSIPDGVTEIGWSAFAGCSSLSDITVPEGVTSIGSSAFERCRSLTNITIPEGVTSIGPSAFYGCTSLQAFSMPGGITSISPDLFHNCSSLTDFDMPANITEIYVRAFQGSGLGSIEIPNSVTFIGDSAFAACRYLRSVTLPPGLTIIRENTFRGCPLTSITIPENVESIWPKAFNGCNFLSTITVKSQTPPQLMNNAFSNYNATVRVPRGCRSTYERANNWSLFANIVEEEEEGGSFYLTVVQPSGTVDFKVQEGQRQELRFTPDDGCSVHSVSYNGADVTALLETDGTFVTPAIHADARVTVVFEQGLQAVAALEAASPQVRVSGQTVHVGGCKPAETLRMYNANGQLILTANADGQGRATMTSTASGLIILSAGNSLFKFILHP